ncbi:MAG: uroporphyrinogen-III synthase [Planctomycetota bacterium]|nr:uroporphyrinogen-III synthase [Planctomycetota bacterium]
MGNQRKDPLPASCTAPLAGRRIAVPESRELETLSRMLEAEGAAVARYPLVAILDAPDPRPVSLWLDRLISGAMQDTIWFTGEGVQRVAQLAQAEGRAGAFVDALVRTRVITRGPKPAKLLNALGVRKFISTKIHTTDGLLALLGEYSLAGRGVGVQMYGDRPNLALEAFLRGRGAECMAVYPYVYAPQSDADRVVELIQEIVAGKLDAVAFTSTSQLRRLQDVAKACGLESPLVVAMHRIVVAAVGPIIAKELADWGVKVHAVPAGSYFMRPLVQELVRMLARAHGPVPATLATGPAPA